MAEYTVKLYERMYPLTYLHSANKSAAAHATSYVCVKDYHRIWVVLDVGTMSQGSTIDLAIQQATDTSGTGVKALSPAKAITQLTQAGGDSDSLVCIEIQTEELDVSNNFDCIRAVLTVGSAASQASLIVYGVEPRFMPVPTTNWQETVQ